MRLRIFKDARDRRRELWCRRRDGCARHGARGGSAGDRNWRCLFDGGEVRGERALFCGDLALPVGLCGGNDYLDELSDNDPRVTLQK